MKTIEETDSSKGSEGRRAKEGRRMTESPGRIKYYKEVFKNRIRKKENHM